MSAPTNPSFYDALPPMRDLGQIFDDRHYAHVPNTWYVALSDIKGSTAAVETGHHSDVNFAAVAMIAGLTNLCGAIPYQFGGDGAVALIPPEHADAARRVLAQTRRFALQEFKLDLRVGLAPVQALTSRGAQVMVGRYEPAPTGAYAVFLGDGIELLEASIKGLGDDTLAARTVISEADDDGQPPDLTGLSCRWAPLKSTHGKMVALVVRGGDHGALHKELTKLVGIPALRTVTLDNLETKWPPKGLMREAKARKQSHSLVRSALSVAAETFIAYVFFKLNLRAGDFSAQKYREELQLGAVDFARSGSTLSVVFDCPTDRIEKVRAYLEGCAGRGELRYGMHLSDHAVMTCLVASATGGKHVHFIDGGDGGYTRAATDLKSHHAGA